MKFFLIKMSITIILILILILIIILILISMVSIPFYFYITDYIRDVIYDMTQPDIKIVHGAATGMIDFIKLFTDKEVSSKYIISKYTNTNENACMHSYIYLVEFDFSIENTVALKLLYLYAENVSINTVITNNIFDDICPTYFKRIFSTDENMSFEQITMCDRQYPNFDKPIALKGDRVELECKTFDVGDFKQGLVRLFNSKSVDTDRYETKFNFHCKENTIEEYVNNDFVKREHVTMFREYFIKYYKE